MDTKFLVYLFAVLALAKSDTARIIGGTESRSKQFKFVAALHIFPLDGRCTGSILTDKWVITAAHCYRGSKIENTYTLITAGTVDFNEPLKGAQLRTSLQHIVHPYNPHRGKGDANWDVTLIEVDNPFIFDDFVGLITIARNFPRIDNYPCTSLGFGRIYSNNVQEAFIDYGKNSHLYHILTTAGDYMYCRHISPLRNWTEEHICVDPVRRGTSTCSGDSGGPLVCNNLLVGTLFGRRSPNPAISTPPCATEGNFQVYMKVSFFTEWIAKHVPNLPMPQPLRESRDMRRVDQESSEKKSSGTVNNVGLAVLTILSSLTVRTVSDWLLVYTFC